MTTDQTHLGGYIPGGDEATYYPDLWRWAVDTLGIKSVLDIGCGEGHALRFFRDELGCPTRGIDGLAQGDDEIRCHDYTLAPASHLADIYDLAWCCEFVEHLEERYLPNVVSSFRSARYVFLTHAFPGQAGHHHVNCRTPDYWLGFFAGIGFTYLPDLTALARVQAAINPSPWNHFVRSGLVFERNS